MYIDDEELRGLYKTSSEEHLQSIESALMALEKQPENLAPLHDLLRAAHTLKGDSRMLGVDDVETLIHQIEECLMPIDKGQASLTSELFDRLYTGIDTIQKIAHTAVTGEPNKVNLFYVLATLMGDGGNPAVAATPSLTGESELFRLDLSIETEDDLFGLVESIDTQLLPIKAQPYLDNLASQLFPDEFDYLQNPYSDDSTLPILENGTVFNDFTLISTPETPTDFESLSSLAGDEFELFLNCDLSIDTDSGNFTTDLAQQIFEPDLFPFPADLFEREMLETSASAHISTPVNIPEPATSDKDRQIDTIRVATSQLDTLIAQTAEINTIDQQIGTRLPELQTILEFWETGSRSYQNLKPLLQELPATSPLHPQLSLAQTQWAEMGALIAKFKQSITTDSSRLNLITSALESGVKKLRLLPLATIFNLFPRMVRDLAKTQSKQINFAIEGGHLLLDKRLLEEIKDPLMHILRNAIDHGIETPAERHQSGKLPAATLMIQVRQTGNQTTISIADDGRGLDLQRIKATAIKRGIYTDQELAGMTTAQIQSLIFAAGFTTRTKVTELSGRGVGLDIVKTNIERLKGLVEVGSLPGSGCTFTIELSHTIGSSSVMMVDVRDSLYAIPVESVDRMLLLNKADIFAIGGTPTATIAGQTMTVAWLADLLSLPALAPNSAHGASQTSKSIACLLLRSGRQQLALLVDQIHDQQLVMIQSPHPVLKNVPHLSGSTILGTGEVCLVLNPADLFTTAAGHHSPAINRSRASEIALDLPPSILLVEDSLVIRTQLKRILGGAGYRVTTANDGLEGWEKLQAQNFDLVVSDVEMPRWDGLQLITAIRKHTQYKDLPAILITTLAKPVDRDRGLQAGANAYLTKGDFDGKLLLDTLTRLL